MHLSPAHRRRLTVLAVMLAVALVLPAGAAARPIDLRPTPPAPTATADPAPSSVDVSAAPLILAAAVLALTGAALVGVRRGRQRVAH